MSVNAVDNKTSVHFWDGLLLWISAGCHYGDTLWKQKQCLIHMFRSKYKRFFLSPSGTCWTVQCSVNLLLLVSGCSPSGEILWRLTWLEAEQCQSEEQVSLMQMYEPYFIGSGVPKFKSMGTQWDNCAFRAVMPLGLDLVLHPKCTHFECWDSSYATTDQNHLHDMETSEEVGARKWYKSSCIPRAIQGEEGENPCPAVYSTVFMISPDHPHPPCWQWLRSNINSELSSLGLFSHVCQSRNGTAVHEFTAASTPRCISAIHFCLRN